MYSSSIIYCSIYIDIMLLCFLKDCVVLTYRRFKDRENLNLYFIWIWLIEIILQLNNKWIMKFTFVILRNGWIKIMSKVLHIFLPSNNLELCGLKKNCKLYYNFKNSTCLVAFYLQMIHLSISISISYKKLSSSISWSLAVVAGLMLVKLL